MRFTTAVARPVLDDFDLHDPPGEKIGLVGRSGPAKSTVVNLLLRRLYDVEGDRIWSTARTSPGVTQDSLRAQVGMVTQDTSLLHRSVRDNIVYGRPGRHRGRHGRAPPSAPRPHEFIAGLADAKGRTATTPTSASAA